MTIALSLRARILGECSTVDYPKVLLVFFLLIFLGRDQVAHTCAKIFAHVKDPMAWLHMLKIPCPPFD